MSAAADAGLAVQDHDLHLPQGPRRFARSWTPLQGPHPERSEAVLGRIAAVLR